MKAAFASVLAGFQGLGSDESRERPVDRLGALGAIQDPGRDLTLAEREILDKRARQAEKGKQTDREAALSALGVRLIAFKFANCAASKADAEDYLAMYLAWPSWKLSLKSRQRTVIARQALMEHAIDFCPSCKGAKVVPDVENVEGTQPVSPCMPCGGTGKRRYTDQERAAAMGHPYAREMGVAHWILSSAEAGAVKGGMELLERWQHY